MWLVVVRSPRFEPGSSAWQADVLDQTRLRPRTMRFYWTTTFGDILALRGVDFVLDSAVIYLFFGYVNYALLLPLNWLASCRGIGDFPLFLSVAHYRLLL